MKAIVLFCMFFLTQGRMRNLCGPGGECICTPYIINCFRSRLSNIPLFSKNESLEVVFFNLKSNFITRINRTLLKKDWPELKVFMKLVYVCAWLKSYYFFLNVILLSFSIMIFNALFSFFFSDN